jgi:hypothetical protein
MWPLATGFWLLDSGHWLVVSHHLHLSDLFTNSIKPNIGCGFLSIG